MIRNVYIRCYLIIFYAQPKLMNINYGLELLLRYVQIY